MKQGEIREQVVAAIERDGWTQAEIARLASIDRSALNRFLRGHGRLDDVRLERLFGVLGLTVSGRSRDQ